MITQPRTDWRDLPMGIPMALQVEVSARYHALPEVVSIRGAITLNGIVYYVYLSNPFYDDALMDRLLTIEDDILNMFPTFTIIFRYIPTVLLAK